MPEKKKFKKMRAISMEDLPWIVRAEWEDPDEVEGISYVVRKYASEDEAVHMGKFLGEFLDAKVTVRKKGARSKVST